MTQTEAAKRIHALLATLRVQHQAPEETAPVSGPAAPAPELAAPQAGAPRAPQDAILTEFLRSFLMWESTTQTAHAALARVTAAVVDFNELRVCLSDEIAELLGPGHAGHSTPTVEDRAARIKLALNDIFKREHAVRLGHLRGLSKREAAAYLDGLAGTPPFVSSRTALIALNEPSLPVDERLIQALRSAGIFDSETNIEAATALLTKAIKPASIPEAHRLLQAFSDTAPTAPGRSRQRAAIKKGQSNGQTSSPTNGRKPAKPVKLKRPGAKPKEPERGRS